MRKKLRLLGSILIGAALVVGITYALRYRTPSVTTTYPTRGEAVQSVYATGTVEPTVMLPIAPRVTARLVELMADEGANVTKGQVLAKLEDQDVQSSLAELDARTRFAQQEYTRQIELLRRGVTTAQARDRARSEWEAAAAAVERVKAEARFLQLEAPADGRIIQRDGEEGELISANKTVFWMACCAPLRISAEVDEEDIALVQPAQKVLIRADAFPEQIFNGTVQAITPKGDAVARSYRVRIGLEKDTPLLIGMTAEANILVAVREEALLVPASALDGSVVWVVRDGTVAAQTVTIGAKSQQQIEIRSGITQEDRIILHPTAALVRGMRVRALDVYEKQAAKP